VPSTCRQRASLPRERTIRCASWQVMHFASMMLLPSPSAKRGPAPPTAAAASAPRSPGGRPGHAGGSAGARTTASDRSKDDDLPTATSIGDDGAL